MNTSAMIRTINAVLLQSGEFYHTASLYKKQLRHLYDTGIFHLGTRKLQVERFTWVGWRMSRIRESDVPVFRYDNEDLNFVVTRNDGANSPFDSLFTKRWRKAQEKGIFKYVLDIKKQKVLEGVYGFLVQLNPDKGEPKYRQHDITRMSPDSDPNSYNFIKMPNREILFNFGNAAGNDVVAANIYPTDIYHSLLITERFKCQPQRVTKYSLKRAIDLLLLSNSTYLRVTFNDLYGCASVNHLHWHLYYLNYEMPLESIKLKLLSGPIFTLVDFPAKGFCLKLSSFSNKNIDGLISWAYFVLDYLQTSSIAHNVYITRAKENSESDSHDDIRIYIWARKASSRVKSAYGFVPAASTLFGHLSMENEEKYEELTEDKVAEILNDITSDNFHAVTANILAMDLDDNELIFPNR